MKAEQWVVEFHPNFDPCKVLRGSPVEIVRALKRHAFFFEGETVDEYVTFVACNVNRAGESLAKQIEPRGDSTEERCANLLTDLHAIGVCKVVTRNASEVR